MKKTLSFVISLFSLFSLQFITLAQPAHGQLRPYGANDNQVRTLLTRIETNTDVFRNRLNNALDTSAINGSQREDEVVQFVSDFEQATDRLRSQFDTRRIASSDIEEVLSRASYIDGFMRSRRLTTAAQNQWSTLRTDLTTLARYYRVAWNWNNNNNTYPGNNTGNNNGGWNNSRNISLTGTYRLNRSASDDVEAAVNKMGTGYNTTNREDRRRNNLVRRLTPPETLAIQKNNREITIASDMAPQVMITADGVARSETSANGRTIRTTAATQGNNLTINYEGDRMNDFYLTFTPSRNQLRVTRRVYLENQNQTITVTSAYDRISPTADWTIVNNGNNTGQVNNGGYNNSYGDFIIPNGTQIVGVLDNALNTRTVTNGEKFTIRVTSPAQYTGAIITGSVADTERSGRVSGRANMTLNFEQIRLRNGRTYQFAGVADQVRLVNGDQVSVTNEGVVRDSNQTTKTAIRSGIGAAIGAIIGAVAGGGSGAAIGAGVGAGAGAGSVIIQGRDDLRLDSGTEFTITASAPQNVGRIR